MIHTVKEVLGREIVLNPYEGSFSEPVKQERAEELDKINKFLRSLMDARNAGKEIDIDRFALQAGIDSETAHSIAEQTMKTIDRMPGRKR